jgi:hypothetical protein
MQPLNGFRSWGLDQTKRGRRQTETSKEGDASLRWIRRWSDCIAFGLRSACVRLRIERLAGHNAMRCIDAPCCWACNAAMLQSHALLILVRCRQNVSICVCELVSLCVRCCPVPCMQACVHVRACVRASGCVRACARVTVRACVCLRACLCVCVSARAWVRA